MRKPPSRYGTVILAALLWLLGASAAAAAEPLQGAAPAAASAEAHGVAASYPDLPYAAQHENRSATLEGVSHPHVRATAVPGSCATPVCTRSPGGSAPRAAASRSIPLQQSCLPPPSR